MTTTNNSSTVIASMSIEERIQAARGQGRYRRRMGLTRDAAVHATIAEHPALAGLEEHVRKGWNAERAGR